MPPLSVRYVPFPTSPSDCPAVVCHGHCDKEPRPEKTMGKRQLGRIGWKSDSQQPEELYINPRPTVKGTVLGLMCPRVSCFICMCFSVLMRESMCCREFH